jgi:hypothetical protein
MVSTAWQYSVNISSGGGFGTMKNGANPTAARMIKNPSEVERKVMCARYQGCLDEAIKKKWVGFSCRKCRAFQPLQLDQTEWVADSLACIALMYVSEFHNSFKQKPRGGIVLHLQREARRPRCVLMVKKEAYA